MQTKKFKILSLLLIHVTLSKAQTPFSNIYTPNTPPDECDSTSCSLAQSNEANQVGYTYSYINFHQKNDAEFCGDSTCIAIESLPNSHCTIENTIYALPYSITGKNPDWHRLWINTATLSGAFVGTLVVLECLPEDATSWNRAELQDVPLFKRWRNHVLKKGPEWDHDKFYFNYILHPYAGAVYFMAARSCGFNAWQSLLYCSLISNVGWEFGIEAFMERPSYQDCLITPLVGSLIGEGFYRLKRTIAENGYTLCGSSALGNIVAYLIDPVNEVLGLFMGNPARQYSKMRNAPTITTSIFTPLTSRSTYGISLCLTF